MKRLPVGDPSARLHCPVKQHFGDLFPLPLPPEERNYKCPSRRSAQRSSRRLNLQQRDCDTISVLNDGAGFSDPSQWPTRALNEAQKSALRHVHQCHASRPMPVKQTTPEAALRQLLHMGPGYDSGTGALAQYRQGEVSLPTDQGEACPLLEILGGQPKEYLENFDSAMLLGDEEFAAVVADSEAPGCHSDPILERDPLKRLEFVVLLYKSGLLRFTKCPKVTVGMFFVK